MGDRFENLLSFLKMTPPPPLTGNKRPVPDRKQSYIFFCSQIVTEEVNAMFPLVSKFKMIGMLLKVVHGQVQKS